MLPGREARLTSFSGWCPPPPTEVCPEFCYVVCSPHDRELPKLDHETRPGATAQGTERPGSGFTLDSAISHGHTHFLHDTKI